MKNRRDNKKILYSIILGAFILITVFLFYGCNEKIESYYKDFNIARKTGAIEKGWIPKYIPNSACDIREIHDLDTNEVWIVFKILSSTDIFFDKVESLSKNEILNKLPRTPRVKWWPQNLKRNYYRNSNYLFYRGKIEKDNDKYIWYFALNKENDTIYSWFLGD